MIKTLKEIGIEGYFLNMIKYVCLCPKASILLNGETLEVFSLRPGTRQELNIRQLDKRQQLEVYEWERKGKTTSI